MTTFAPVIKWSGSKRSQAAEIIRRFPCEIDTYYEPFCGGAAVLRRLLMTPSIKVKHYVCADKNQDLISLWGKIKNEPDYLAHNYRGLWLELNKDDNLDRKKQFFIAKREEFNKTRDAALFLFIMRTAYNGMPRYNVRGEFNSSFHLTRKGIEPSELEKILHAWNVALNHHKVDFICRSYDDASFNPTARDLIYCDPPYYSVKGHSMYDGGIDAEHFFSWLRTLKCKWVLSFDGRRGDTDYTYSVPSILYKRHEYLKAGKSSFERCLGNGRIEDVFDSLYLNFIPDLEERKMTQEEFAL